MAIGFFMGIMDSYTEDSKDVGKKYINSINDTLRENNLKHYRDPDTVPDVYINFKFGRSSLDHHVVYYIKAVCNFVPNLPQLTAISKNPYRISFVPIAFSKPLITSHQEKIGSEQYQVLVGSLPALLEELKITGHELGVRDLKSGLSDEIASKINKEEFLRDGEDAELLSLRNAWLVIYEGTRLAIENDVALSIAG